MSKAKAPHDPDDAHGVDGLGALGAYARARKSDPETSHGAARRMNRKGKVAQHNLLIYAALSEYGPQNGRQLGEATELGQVPVMRRMSGLVEAGKVRDSGEKKDGQTVWELV